MKVERNIIASIIASLIKKTMSDNIHQDTQC